jgi:WD40 repeat protein
LKKTPKNVNIILDQAGGSTMKKNKIWAMFAVFAFLVNACGGNQSGTEIQQTSIAATIQAGQISATATITPTATPTVTPTPAPVKVGMPVPLPVGPITASNANRIIGVARWGKDEAVSVNEVAVSTAGEVFAIATQQGVDVYDGSTLQLLRHFDAEDPIRLVVSAQRELITFGQKTREGLTVVNYATGQRLKELPWGWWYPRHSFSPDGNYLAMINPDNNSIAVYETSGLTEIYSINPESEVYQIGYSSDSSILLAGASNGFFLWNSKNGDFVKEIERYGNIEPESLLSPDGMYYLERKGPELVERYSPEYGAYKVNVYYFNLVEVASGERRQTLESEYGRMDHLAFSPDGKSVAFIAAPGSGMGSGTLYFWNLDIDRARMYEMKSEVLDLKFSPDGKYLAIIQGNSTVEVRQIIETSVSSGAGSYKERRPEKFLSVEHQGVKGFFFVGGGDNLLSISGNTVKIWSLKGNSIEEALALGESQVGEFGNDPVLDIVVSPDSKYLAAVSAEIGIITIWQIGNGQPLKPYLQVYEPTAHDYHNVDLAFTAVGKYLIVLDKGEYESYEYQWSFEDKKRTRESRVENYYLDFTEDYTVTVALQNTGGALYILELTDGDTVIFKETANFKEVKRIECLATNVSNLLFSPDQSLIITFWQKGEKPCTNEPAPTSSPDGIERPREWNLSILNSGGVPLNEKELDTTHLLYWAISPDSAYLALTTTKPGPDFSDTYEVGLDILDSGSGDLLRRVPLRFVNIDGRKSSPIAFSPDSSLIAVGNSPEEGNVALIQVSDGQLLRTLDGHTDIVTDLVFSKDGLWLASSSADGSIRLWGIP